MLPSDHFSQWILSPILHLSTLHLFGNMLTLAISGALVELWITNDSIKGRMFLFAAAFLIHYLVNALRWHVAGETAFGSSLVVYAFIGFAIVYYISILDSQQGPKASRIAPIAVGFLIGFIIARLFSEFMLDELITAVNLNREHALAFTASLFSFFYFKKNKISQKSKKLRIETGSHANLFVLIPSIQ